MISPKVMVELHQAKLVPTQFTVTKPGEHAWSSAEQRRFWEAIHRFPQGPWTAIAAYVGSKSTRQAMTHAQKLRQKLNRWKRRVRNDSASSSGASSPCSDMNECDDECDDEDALSPLDEDALSPLDEGSEQGDDQQVDMKREYAEQLDYHQHRRHTMAMPPTTKAAFFAFSSQSPDDVSCDNDEYLDHLLSDIEPVLENVVNFSSPPHSSNEYDDASGANATYYSGEFAVTHVYPMESKHQQLVVHDHHHHASIFDQQYASHLALAPHSSPMQPHQAPSSVNEYSMASAADFRL